jgi:Ca2+:H+ antiporter
MAQEALLHGPLAGPRHASAARQYGPMLGAAASLGLLTLYGPGLTSDASFGVSLLVSAWLFAVILWGAIGVMLHAEVLAEALGEPFGTLILTLSAITVEIALIMSVMLAGEPNPALARDTMFSVLMIVLNGLLGVALLLGGLRHRQQVFNLEGARAFLVVLTPLAVCALVLPNFTTLSHQAALTSQQAIVFGVATLLLYGVFLALQASRHRNFFAEAAATPEPMPAPDPRARHRRALVLRHAALLLLTIVPVALLADHMAAVLEVADRTLRWPPELVGVIIATLILAPEGLAALRAAWENRLQRSVNILLGSALSTIGLTVPATLILGVVIGHEVILGLPGDYMILLGATLLVTSLTFGTTKTDMLKGAVHLVLFVIYLMLVVLP